MNITLADMPCFNARRAMRHARRAEEQESIAAAYAAEAIRLHNEGMGKRARAANEHAKCWQGLADRSRESERRAWARAMENR